MKTMLKKLTLAAIALSSAVAYCPQVGDLAQPKGLRRSGADAIFTKTWFGNLVVFTEQDDHEFTPSADALEERAGAGLPAVRHRRCTTCDTYNVQNKCGYTLVTDGQD